MCISNPAYRLNRGITRILPLLLWILLLAAIPSFAQKLLNPTPVFEHFNGANGLPDVRIRNIFQDSKGFLWIATMTGITRYDGYSFKSFTGEDVPGTLAGAWAHAITEDTKGKVWFGGREGISNYDLNTNAFAAIEDLKNNSFLNKGINALYCDPQGMLWIGTPNGLASYSIASKKLERLNDAAFAGPVTVVIPAEKGLWIATHNAVVNFQPSQHKTTSFALQVKPNPYGDRIWNLLEEKERLLIATAADGLLQLPLNGTATAVEPYKIAGASSNRLQSLQVFDVRRSASGDLWLATEHGLAKLSGKQDEEISFYRNNPLSDKTISNSIVYKLLLDKDNNLWCGTESGLNKLNLNLLPFNFFAFAGLDARDQVRGIAATPGGDILFGTANTGLHKYSRTSSQTQAIPLPGGQQNIRCVTFVKNGLWVGTLDGLYRPVGNGYARSLEHTAVFALLEDAKGDVWVGANKGLFRINAAGKTGADSPVVRGFVRSLYETSGSDLWIGFENGTCGILDSARTKFTEIKDASGKSLPVANYYSIAHSNASSFWLGSSLGLFKVSLENNKSFSFKKFTDKDGLPEMPVNCVLPDNQGNLWLSTLQGIIKFDPVKSFFSFYLQGIEGGSNAGTVTSEGNLVFAANDGLILFNPERLKQSPRAPDVLLTSLKVSNQTVEVNKAYDDNVILSKTFSQTKDIKLNYKNSVFTIGFVGLHFANPSRNRYMYKLEGFDKDWLMAEPGARSVTYTNLDPGDYTFYVKAASNVGNWSQQPATVKITILPPPWKTWWAKTLYFIAFNLLLWSILRFMHRQNKQRSQLRIEQMEKEQIRRMNEMKTTFFTDISHEFRTPLSLIVSPVEELLHSPELEGDARIKMKLVHDNARKLLALVNELMTFQKMEQGSLQLTTSLNDIVALVNEVSDNFKLLASRKQITLKVTGNIPRLLVYIDKPKMEIVLNNLLSNAFKFTPAGGEVNINLHLKDDDPGFPKLIIKVSDNGQGIAAKDAAHLFQRFFSQDNEAGTGVGLSLTKKMLELHKGIISVESTPGVLTVFTIELPLDANYQVQQEQQMPEPELPPDFVTANEELPAIVMEEGAASRPVLLLVEDNHEVMDYLELLFRDEFAIIKAADGDEAWEYLEKEDADLVVSDVMMPGKNGIDLCRQIKTSLHTSHIPVILLTAKSTLDNKKEGLETGADDYIAKPFHPAVLKLKVRNLIETRKRVIEKYRTAGTIKPQVAPDNPIDKEFLENVMAAIERNLDNEAFGVEELGKEIFMSRSHLFRKLKALTGQNPLELIYSIRMKKAMVLLLERKLSIASVAYEVGFKSPSAFSAYFKKQYGKTPSEYINELVQQSKEE